MQTGLLRFARNDREWYQRRSVPPPGEPSPRLHRLLHRGDELAQRKRLWQEVELLAFGQALLEGVLGIAGDEDELDVGVLLAHRLEQRRAVHLGHHDVGD